MSGQQKYAIIKALAYGETPQQASEAEGVSVSEVQKVQCTYAADIANERETLKKAGYING